MKVPPRGCAGRRGPAGEVGVEPAAGEVGVERCGPAPGLLFRVAVLAAPFVLRGGTVAEAVAGGFRRGFVELCDGWPRV
ncbi:MAG: hypothetical protein ACXVZO_11395, partial [Gaiellaceae bacterium]